MDLSGSHFEIDRASVTGAGGDDWWGHFAFPKASLDLTEKNVSLDLNAHCLDSRPLRALFAVEGVPAFVATIFTMKGLEATGSLHAGPKLLRLTDLDVHGKGASIRANYLAEGGKKRGEALIKLGIATAGARSRRRETPRRARRRDLLVRRADEEGRGREGERHCSAAVEKILDAVRAISLGATLRRLR